MSLEVSRKCLKAILQYFCHILEPRIDYSVKAEKRSNRFYFARFIIIVTVGKYNVFFLKISSKLKYKFFNTFCYVRPKNTHCYMKTQQS